MQHLSPQLWKIMRNKYTSACLTGCGVKKSWAWKVTRSGAVGALAMTSGRSCTVAVMSGKRLTILSAMAPCELLTYRFVFGPVVVLYDEAGLHART